MLSTKTLLVVVSTLLLTALTRQLWKDVLLGEFRARMVPKLVEARAVTRTKKRAEVLDDVVLVNQRQPQKEKGDEVLATSSDIAAVVKCPAMAPPAEAAQSVRKLHPGQIRVVAAVGDSLSAGFAAVDGLPLEFRGLSFDMGGEAGRVTLPNLLQRYTGTKGVFGGSVGTTIPVFDAAGFWPNRHAPLRPVDAGIAHLNAAISNTVAADGPGQVEWLAQAMARFQASGDISISDDWKLITVLLGANDLLTWCRGHEPAAKIAAAYKSRMNETLALLRSHFPRTFVSLLGVPDVSVAGKFLNGTKMCSFVQKNIEHTFCPPGGETQAVHQAMNAALEELQNYWSDTVQADDFAVVFQPFSESLNLPNITYVSAYDCFHPNSLAHVELSVALWNSLLTPRAQKRRSAEDEQTMLCATADSVLHVD